MIEFLKQYGTDKTSIHALPRIVKASSLRVKTIWMAIFLMTSSFSSYMIFKNINKYLQFEVTTKIRYVYESDSVFPLITICNKNPLITEFAKDMLDNLSIKNDLSELFDLNGTKSEEHKTYFSVLIGLGLLYAKSDHLNDTEKKKLGYPFEDMLIDCKFEASTCSASEFEWYYDYNYGNCYRFNSGWLLC
jgi:hypothetical protein